VDGWFVKNFPTHQALVFSIDCISFTLVAFCGSGFWWTTERQIFRVPVAVFEAFHLMSHPAGTHAGIYIDVMKLIKDVCGRIVLI
jgi:hypothetical protein